MYAVMRGHDELVMLLLDAGANINMKERVVSYLLIYS
jgi:hypothetical protein